MIKLDFPLSFHGVFHFANIRCVYSVHIYARALVLNHIPKLSYVIYFFIASTVSILAPGEDGNLLKID